DRRDRRFPRAVGRRLVVQHEVELGAGRDREIAPVVLARFQRMAVDRNDEVAGSDLQVIVVGRTALVDVADFVEARGIAGDVEAGIARGDSERVGFGPPLTPVCDALRCPIIIIMTLCSSSSSTMLSSSGAYISFTAFQFAP